MRVFLLGFFSCFYVVSIAQTTWLNTLHGGLGVTSLSTNPTSSFASINNMASAANYSTVNAGIVAEQRFGLNSLRNVLATAHLPIKKIGTIGLQLQYFGDALLNQNKITLLYARTLGGKASIAAGFTYQGIQGANYGRANLLNAQLAIQYHVNEQISIGAQINQIGKNKFGINKDETIPAQYRTGIGYTASKQVMMQAEIIKIDDLPAFVQAGVVYVLHPKISLFGSVQTASNQYSAAVNVQLKDIQVVLGITYQNLLGVSPVAGFQYFKQAASNE
jgi:hypothetical protein